MIVLAGVPSWALAGGLACADAPRGANASNVTPRRTPVSKGRRCHRRKRLAAMGPVPDKASARPTTATMAERSLTVTHAVGAKITDCQNRAEQCATQKRPLPRRYPARVFKRGEAVLRATRALGLRKHRTTPPVFLGDSRRTGIEQGGRLQHLARTVLKSEQFVLSGQGGHHVGGVFSTVVSGRWHMRDPNDASAGYGSVGVKN